MIETGDLKMNKPLVSVILPTYNTEKEYLKEAIIASCVRCSLFWAVANKK